jgi:DNA-binding NarL/FixJ family response regulator
MSVRAVSPLTLLVVDVHPVFLDVLAQAIEAEPDLKIVASASNAEAAVAAWRRHRPAVTLIDLRIPGVDGIRMLRQIRSLDAEAGVLVFTSADSRRDIAATLEAGADGCITKSMRYHDLLAAIRKVHVQGRGTARAVAVPGHNGKPRLELTSREVEVLVLLRDGFSQDQISRRLAIADRTVRVHVGALKEKLAAASTVQCVAKAYELGILRS